MTTRSRSVPKYVGASWAAYFSLAPVVWLPGVAPVAVYVLKSVLFVIAIASTYQAIDFKTPRGLRGPIGVILLVILSIPAVVTAVSPGNVGRWAFEIVLMFLTAWLFYSISDLETVRYSLTRAGQFHAFLSLFIIGAALIPSLDIVSPFERTLTVAGFHGLRTGWAHSVAYAVPFVVASGFSQPRTRQKLWLYAAAGATILGQFIVGGRSGLLATLIAVGIVTIHRFGFTRTIGIASVVIAGILGVYWEELAEPLRIDRLSHYRELDEQIDYITSLRYSLLQDGLELIAEKPLFGHGLGESSIDVGGDVELIVHVTWLRIWIELGIGVALYVFGIVVSGLVLMIRARTRFDGPTGNAMFAGIGLLVAGLFLSFLEAAVVVGAFNHSAPVWALVGFAWTFERRSRTAASIPRNSGSKPRVTAW